MKIKEKFWEIIFLLAAGFSFLAVLLICLFLFANGIPAIQKIGVADFLFGTKWKPENDLYGIFPMIFGSFYVTAGAVIVGVLNLFGTQNLDYICSLWKCFELFGSLGFVVCW